MTASQTGGKKGAWRAGRLFTRLGSTTMNTKRPFADDKPGTGLAPRPKVCVSCYIRGPEASQATRSLLLSLFFKGSSRRPSGATSRATEAQ